MRNLSPLLRPKSIAVLGGSWAENVVEQCLKLGFQGDIWPVHPTRETIAGVQAFASLSDLPSAPDACFIGVNRHATVEIVAELAAMGAGGAICFAAGWTEAGAEKLQADLVAAAASMPILGPNCYGLLNMFDGAAIWPDQHGGRRIDKGVAIISQSSNIAITLTMQRRGLPIGYVACVGNAAQCGAADLATSFAADPRVTAIGLYLEGIDDPHALAAVAQAARQSGKPLVAIKAGRSAAGASAAASHTAAMAGSAAAASAFLAQAGIAQVDTLAQMIDTLKIFHRYGALGGNRIASSSCSGGEAGLMADMAEDAGLIFPPLKQSQREQLRSVLGNMVTLSNPLDYNTFIWGDRAKIADVFQVMTQDVDASLYIIDPPRDDICDASSFDCAIDAIADVASGATPTFAVATLADTYDEQLIERFADKGITTLSGLETALAAVKAAGQPAGIDGWTPLPAVAQAPNSLMSEAAAKTLLQSSGIAVPKFISASGFSAAKTAAVALTPPFAVKGSGFAHKTEAGAVRLNVTDLDAEPDMPNADGYLIEEMVKGGIAEMLVGLRRDAIYGGTLTLATGGVLANLLDDSVTLILPVSKEEITAALTRLKLYPLIDGYRGRDVPDLQAFVHTIDRMQQMILANPGLHEIEINPMILTRDTAIAVDALIRTGEHE